MRGILIFLLSKGRKWINPGAVFLKEEVNIHVPYLEYIAQQWGYNE